MVDPIIEAESLCRKTLEILDSLQDSSLKNIIATRNKLQDLLKRIAESKKKIMIRSPQGKGLSAEVLIDVSRLHEVAASLSQSRLNDQALEKISNRLEHLQNSVEKLEIYWKSFEYVTT